MNHRRPNRRRNATALFLATVMSAGLVLIGSGLQAYPIDAYDDTGIRRVEWYRLALLGEVNGLKVPPGGRLPMKDVYPRLAGTPKLPELTADPALSRQIRQMLGKDADKYSVALLDFSDPQNPIYAQHNDGMRSNVGSVGKAMVGVGFFQILADIYPDDLEARRHVLHDTVIVADEFVQWDSHKVVFFDVEKRDFEFRIIKLGDSGTLWEWLDWMLSASNNAAAATVQKQIILMDAFRERYPVSKEEQAAWWKQNGATKRGEIYARVMEGALTRNGLDVEKLRQGSFFTRYGKNHVVGKTSYGNTKELVRLLYIMERGELVDEWSSTEYKRLLYMTQRRIRYASHPALNGSAVYFKSGSLYSCQPEEGFVCGKYKGNKRNQLASIALVESPARDPLLNYAVAVSSNVLRVNSAVAHQTLAMRIHRMLEGIHRDKLDAAAARAAAEAAEAAEELDQEAREKLAQ